MKKETKIVGIGQAKTVLQNASVYERSDLTEERLAFWRRAVWKAHHHAAGDSEAKAFAEALLAHTGWADDVGIAGAWARWKATGAISYPWGFPS